MCQVCGCSPCKKCGKEIRNGVCSGCNKAWAICTCDSQKVKLVSPISQKNKKGRKILLVDSHPVMRVGLKYVLEQDPSLVICGEGDDIPSAMSLIKKTAPDVVITALSFKMGSGIDLAKEIKANHPNLPVLVFSMHDESLYAERSLRAGARGYLMKECDADLVIKAVLLVLDGKIYLSEKMTKLLLCSLAGQRVHPKEASLTNRQLQVYTLIGGGKSINEIANHLRLSKRTVRRDRSSIIKKLELRSVVELEFYAKKRFHYEC